MTMTDVVNLLVSMNLQPCATPDGVWYEWYFDSGCGNRSGRHRFRVERGSGIAGRGDAWSVVELRAIGTLDTVCAVRGKNPKVTTKRELRRQVLETLAEGNKPPDRDGYETYARWHTYGLTSSVQWFQRRKRGVGR